METLDCTSEEELPSNTTKTSREEALLDAISATVVSTIFHPKGSRGGPGKVIESMSEEKRVQLRELKSSDIQKVHDYALGLNGWSPSASYGYSTEQSADMKAHDERCMRERKVMRPSDNWGKKGIF